MPPLPGLGRVLLYLFCNLLEEASAGGVHPNGQGPELLHVQHPDGLGQDQM